MKLGNFNLVSETQNVSSHSFLPPKVNSFTSNWKIKLIYMFLKQNLAETYSISPDCSLLKVQGKKKKKHYMHLERDQSWFLSCKMGIIPFVIPAELKLPDDKSPQHHLPLRASLVLLCPQMLCLIYPTRTMQSSSQSPAQLPRATQTQLQVPTALLITPLPPSWAPLDETLPQQLAEF